MPRRRAPSTPHGVTVHPQEYVPEFAIADMIEHPENPRTSDDEGIAASMQHNGFYGTVLIQRSTGHLLYGHGRMRTAAAEGLTHLPALIIDVDDDRARRILLVDNKSSDDASYNRDRLTAILAELDRESDLLGTLWANDDLQRMLGTQPAVPPGGWGEGGGGSTDERWMVVVDCTSEADQVALIERLTEEGMTVRALLS